VTSVALIGAFRKVTVVSRRLRSFSGF
jgi:hypothetical protein